MSIGYACLGVGILGADYKTLTLKNTTPERLQEVIRHNLSSLEAMLRYNSAQGIRLFRMSSDIIPFGSHPINTLDWEILFAEKFQQLGNLIRESQMRVSMHPGQYTVINSLDEEVVMRSVAELAYHSRFMDALGLDQTHKMVLHIGGAYGNKPEAMERFITNYSGLDEGIKKRLVLENDDRTYTASEVFSICQKTGAPMIYDNLHDQVNPSVEEPLDTFGWINLANTTWEEKDGPQKIHYSQQRQDGKPGAHSQTIDAAVFMDFYHGLNRQDIDIMLEVKDKNLSAVKCQCLTQKGKKSGLIEKEWAKYKYFVLSKSANDYQMIRQLLKDKETDTSMSFYQIIENAFLREKDPGAYVNALQHMWGYFKESASQKEKQQFMAKIQAYQQGKIGENPLKSMIYKKAQQVGETYLLNSLFFYIDG